MKTGPEIQVAVTQFKVGWPSLGNNHKAEKSGGWDRGWEVL